MATLEQQTALSAPEQPQSVQPGGFGWCVRLELACGRLRRTFLRTFRPDYVRRMAEKRQGHCLRCPHDIIDSRDLKFVRNVCGYRFRPEDDPFRARDRLGVARYGWAELLCFSTLFLLLLALTLVAAWFLPPPYRFVTSVVAVALTVLWVFVIRFFRDPERKIPTDAAALVSPADGTVTHLEEVEDPDFPDGRAFRVSIFLSVFSVHVNRVPRTGRVANVQYFRGCFLDARNVDCAKQNEQLWLDVEEADTGRKVRVKQISGAIARRIVCWLKPGDEVRAGDRYGMIKFGSRTDLLIPASVSREVLVKVGDPVQGGSTILLRYVESS